MNLKEIRVSEDRTILRDEISLELHHISETTGRDYVAEIRLNANSRIDRVGGIGNSLYITSIKPIRYKQMHVRVAIREAVINYMRRCYPEYEIDGFWNH